MKNNNLVFDVETAGSLFMPLIYDFGYVITNPQGKLLKKQRFLVKEIFQEKSLMTSAYFANKVKVHYKELEHITVPFQKVMEVFQQDIEKYDIKKLMAYNLNFDIRATVNTYNRLITENKKTLIYNKDTKKVDYKKSFKKLIQGNYNYLDLWGLACETIMIQEEYKEFILDNGFLTEKGNYLTNAECCYKHMFDDVNYEEKHTALDDAIDESMIFHNIVRKDMYKTQTYKNGFVGSPWQIVKRFFQVKWLKRG